MNVAPSQQLTPDLVRYFRATRFAPISGLEPMVLSRQLETFDAGYLRDFALSASAIARRDDKVVASLPKRYKAPARHGFTVQLLDGLSDAQRTRAVQHQEAVKYCYDNLTATHVLDRNQRGGFRLLIRQMMEAVGMRYAVHELVWQPRVVDGKARLTFTAHYTPLWFFENTTGQLRFLKTLSAVEGTEMEDTGWLVTVGEGIMEAISVCWMYKQMSLRDWVAYNEKFGMPGLLGKTSASKDSPSWKAMTEAVEAFAQDWAAVCNQGETIELIEAKGSGSLPFPTLIERMDRAIVQISRGGDLGTMSADGQAVGSNPQESETEMLEEDDVEMLAETLQHTTRIVCDQLFGEEPLCYVSINVPKAKSTEDTVKKIDTLVDRGAPVSVSWARQELGVPEPGKEEAVLTAKAQPQSGFGGLGAPDTLALPNAASDGDLVAFLARASARYGATAREAIRPLMLRLAQIEALPDATAQRAALTQLRAELPALAKPIIARVPQLGRVFETIIAPAVVSGFAEAAQKTSPTA